MEFFQRVATVEINFLKEISEDIELKRISVVGLGKLGAPLAACFAYKGIPTIGVDVEILVGSRP